MRLAFGADIATFTLLSREIMGSGFVSSLGTIPRKLMALDRRRGHERIARECDEAVITETMLTIAEAAEATGLTHKAIRNRLDRGQIDCVLHNGVRRIPRSELLRVGLLEDSSGQSLPHDGATKRGRLPRPQGPPDSLPQPELASIVDQLHDRLEQQSIELGRARLVAEQYEATGADDIALLQSAVRALEIELRLVRAELANAELRINRVETSVITGESRSRRRRLWGRRGKGPDDDGTEVPTTSSE